MDKSTPTYDLASIQAEFCSIEKLRITRTAWRDAQDLSIQRIEIVQIISKLTRANFYKSMTCQANHKVWQDVYHYAYGTDLVLYIKFTVDDLGKLLISFKEK